MIHKTASLADQIFDRLEADILSGKYQRGDLLTEVTLSEDLGVSRTPIREAIRRLEQEHIVESTGKGIEVLSITIDDAMIIYDIRILAEGLAAKACAEHITDAQAKELRDLVDLQEFYIRKGDTEKVKSIDSQFHEAIYNFAGSPVYADTLLPLHNKIQKFRKAVVSASGCAEISNGEHRAILDAIVSRDGEKAELAMRSHVEKAKMRLSAVAEKENV